MKNLTVKDLVSFGNYLLSERGKVSRQVLKSVTDADISNWKEKKKKGLKQTSEVY